MALTFSRLCITVSCASHKTNYKAASFVQQMTRDSFMFRTVMTITEIFIFTCSSLKHHWFPKDNGAVTTLQINV